MKADIMLDYYLENNAVFSSKLAFNSRMVYQVYKLKTWLTSQFLRLRAKNSVRADFYLAELIRFEESILSNNWRNHDYVYFINASGELPYQVEDMADISSILEIADLCKGLTKNECMLKLKEEK